jgi:hypothetical protein
MQSTLIKWIILIVIAITVAAAIFHLLGLLGVV